MIEPLLLTATQISTFDGQRLLTKASGFFFERDERLYLVTSRHVVIDEPSEHRPNRIEIELHVDDVNLTRSTGFSVLLYREARASGTKAGTPVARSTWRSSNWTARHCRARRSCVRSPRPTATLARRHRGRHVAADRGISARLSRHAAPSAGGAPGGDRLVVRPAFPGPGLLPHRCTHAPRHQRRAGGDARPPRRAATVACRGNCWACTPRAWTCARAICSRTNRLGLNCAWYADILLTLTESGGSRGAAPRVVNTKARPPG